MEQSEKQSVAYRIKSLIEEMDMTVRKFETECGITIGTLSKAINEDRSMGVDKIKLITDRFPEVNAGWLVSGQGEMFLNMSASNNVVHEQGESYMTTSQLVARIISTAVKDPKFEEDLLSDLERIAKEKKKK